MDYRERWELKDYLSTQVLERRVRLFHVAVVLLLLGFLMNFWYLQGVRGRDYDDLAENNRLRRLSIPANRGTVIDRRGRVLASSRPSVSVLLLREGFTRAEQRAQLGRLASVLGIPYPQLLERLDRMQRRPDFEPMLVQEDVSLAALAQIEAHRERFSLVGIEQSIRRHYPQGPLLAHVLGYVGEVSLVELARQDSDGQLVRGDIVGKTGVERAFDERVRGQRGWKVVSVNSLGRWMGEGRVGLEPRHGATLQLTIDLDMQRALQEGMGDEAGAGVFLDPWTGEVLALYSAPPFDPNRFADGISQDEWQAMAADPRRPLHDRAIASFYAPGSTFKIVMAVAGLESGTVRPGDRVFCNGSAVHYGRTRLCWNRGGHGWVNLREALAQSCNVYFYQLGRDLGIERIHEYGTRFGLGLPTGIDIPGEEPGILGSDAWKRATHQEPWYPGDTVSVAIGQGLLATTPLQMAAVAAGIATGSRCTPHVVAGRPPDAPRPLDVTDSTLRLVRSAMEEAVDAGTARRAGLEGVIVAGKTGTAQVYGHSAGIDSARLPKAERDHAWFVGYAGRERPEVAFAVIVEHGGHGGATAAPIARHVLEQYFATQPGVEGVGDPRATAQAGAGGSPTEDAVDDEKEAGRNVASAATR